MNRPPLCLECLNCKTDMDEVDIQLDCVQQCECDCGNIKWNWQEGFEVEEEYNVRRKK